MGQARFQSAVSLIMAALAAAGEPAAAQAYRTLEGPPVEIQGGPVTDADVAPREIGRRAGAAIMTTSSSQQFTDNVQDEGFFKELAPLPGRDVRLVYRVRC